MSFFDGLRFRRVGSPIHNLDPRVKFAYTIVIFTVAIIFWQLIPLTILFIMQVPLVLLAGVKREWTRSMKGASFLASIIFITNFIASFMGSGYVVTFSAIENALAMTIRFLVLVGSFSIFFLTTSPDYLGLALEQSYVPYEFCFAFTTAVRFVPVLAEEAQTIMDAQRARGLELEKGNFFRKVRNYIPILIPLIVSAIRRSLEMAEAMEARAWGATKRRTNLYVLELRRGDYIFMAVTVSILVTAVLIRLYTYVPRLEELLAKMF